MSSELLSKLVQLEIKEERKFLHDISSPVGTALFILDSILDPNQRVVMNPGDLKQLKNAYESLLKTKDMIQERRRILIEKQDQGQVF